VQNNLISIRSEVGQLPVLRNEVKGEATGARQKFRFSFLT